MAATTSCNERSRMALLTVRAAAERLGVGYSTLKRWVHTGHVRTTRTEGGHHRVSEAEIDRLLARQQPERPTARSRSRRGRVPRRPERAQPPARVHRRGAHRRTARPGAAAGRRSVADRGHHRRCRACAEAAPGRRCDGDHQVDGSHDRDVGWRRPRPPSAARGSSRRHACRRPPRTFTGMACCVRLLFPTSTRNDGWIRNLRRRNSWSLCARECVFR